MNSEQLFPDYEGKQQENLYEFTMALSRFGQSCLKYSVLVSLFGIFMNLFHIRVLTQRNMRVSSTNTIMIGLAFSDIGLMIVSILTYYTYFWDVIEDYQCEEPYTYLQMILINFRKVMNGFFRRSSSWIAIIMAIIRTVLVRNALNNDFKLLTTSKCGWICIVSALTLSLCVTVLDWFTMFIVEVTEDEPWQPADHCEGFPVNYSRVALNFEFNKVITPIYLVTNAITSKIIPCVAFPFLTVLLIAEFRRALKKLKKTTTAAIYERDSERGERTTKLVIYTTIIFMIVELPQGICAIVNAIDFYNYGFIFWADSLNEVFTFVGYMNSSSHGIVCYIMSSKYRSTFKELFSCRSSRVTDGRNSVASRSTGARGKSVSENKAGVVHRVNLL